MSKYDRNIFNLRDVQEAIERGKFDTLPLAKWLEDYGINPANEFPKFCKSDGTIFRGTECPSPYHPKPRPRELRRLILWTVATLGILTFVVTLLVNEDFAQLVRTVVLILLTLAAFVLLFTGFIYIAVKRFPDGGVERVRFIGTVTALLSSVFAMVVVSFLQGQFPPVTWWLIELALAFLLENPGAEILARFLFRHVFEGYDLPEIDTELGMCIYLCVENDAPQPSHRMLFFVSCLSIAFWFYSLVIFGGRLAPLWLIPIILTPYAVWLWKFYERFFKLFENKELRSEINKNANLFGYVDAFKMSLIALLRPTDIELRDHRWLKPLFYVSMSLPPGFLFFTIIVLGKQEISRLFALLNPNYFI